MLKFILPLVVLLFKSPGKYKLSRHDDPTADYDDYLP
jgi:hypothetical protein